ncbi:MAG TPA: DNA polymerase III subunit delta', partial [Bryobacteraceae bacterium]|nr:DNA polymerase III subunit delta' [Bryobacteraceae bacterium]
AANSLLKTLEEPPEHLILFATAANPYDLLPTIRSRSVMIHLSPLGVEEMREFVRARGLDEPERRVALAQGSPGLAMSLDLDAYDKRREIMLTVLEAAARVQPFGAWVRQAEAPANRSEKLEPLLRTLYDLLEDVLVIQNGGGNLRNADIAPRITALASRVSFEWVRRAVARADELAMLARRNIQKNIALDAMVAALR